MRKTRTRRAWGSAMGWVLSLLFHSLMNSKRKYYTQEELDALKREAGERDKHLPPKLEDKRKPYKWWKFRA